MGNTLADCGTWVSRNVILGGENNTIAEDSVVNSTLELPDEVSQDQLNQIQSKLEKFLELQADALGGKGALTLKAAIDESRNNERKEGHQAGWKSLCQFWDNALNTSANLVTLLTPVFGMILGK